MEHFSNNPANTRIPESLATTIFSIHILVGLCIDIVFELIIEIFPREKILEKTL